MSISDKKHSQDSRDSSLRKLASPGGFTTKEVSGLWLTIRGGEIDQCRCQIGEWITCVGCIPTSPADALAASSHGVYRAHEGQRRAGHNRQLQSSPFTTRERLLPLTRSKADAPLDSLTQSETPQAGRRDGSLRRSHLLHSSASASTHLRALQKPKMNQRLSTNYITYFLEHRIFLARLRSPLALP